MSQRVEQIREVAIVASIVLGLGGVVAAILFGVSWAQLQVDRRPAMIPSAVPYSQAREPSQADLQRFAAREAMHRQQPEGMAATAVATD
jgi:hypothetical protein